VPHLSQQTINALAEDLKYRKITPKCNTKKRSAKSIVLASQSSQDNKAAGIKKRRYDEIDQVINMQSKLCTFRSTFSPKERDTVSCLFFNQISIDLPIFYSSF